MTTDGARFSMEFDFKRARAGDLFVVRSGVVVASQGTLPVGLILTKGASGLVPYQEVAEEVLGTGDDETAEFSGTLENVPLEPGSVGVTDGVETFADDGHGHLTGDAGGSGTVNYNTGDIAVTFNSSVANEVNVEVDYVTRIDGVLDEICDTTKNASANYVRWGQVQKSALKVGAVTKAAPDPALLGRLENRNIFPV